MEAKSVEDKGKAIEFNVFVYNVQPGISIDYKTGESTASKAVSGQKRTSSEKSSHESTSSYIMKK